MTAFDHTSELSKTACIPGGIHTCPGGARPPVQAMIAFIDDHRQAHGVEPICKVLPIALSTYHAHVAKRVDPSRLSARDRRDAALKEEVRRVFDANFRIYGVRKVWRQLQREGFDVARCTVARLMRAMGLEGVIRGKPIRTTVSDKGAPCPFDHVNRQFHAPAPNMLWAPTSPTSRPGQASSMSPLSSTPMRKDRRMAGKPDGPCELRPGRSGTGPPRSAADPSRRARAP